MFAYSRLKYFVFSFKIFSLWSIMQGSLNSNRKILSPILFFQPPPPHNIYFQRFSCSIFQIFCKRWENEHISSKYRPISSIYIAWIEDIWPISVRGITYCFICLLFLENQFRNKSKMITNVNVWIPIHNFARKCQSNRNYRVLNSLD